jgi:hypothetical protein
VALSSVHEVAAHKLSFVRLEFERDLVSSGPLYAYLVATWRFVFTPAVGLAFLDFALFILHSTSALVAVAAAILAGAVTIYYVRTRPKLGTDEKSSTTLRRGRRQQDR